MSAPNRNTLWGRAVAEELARAGVSTVVVSPGSRSTPLTAAVDAHDDLTTYSVLDERSAAYFALGRAKRTGEVTPLVCTSGTAAANYHPAVVEADQARVPLLLLTADRPPELRDSGANQTVDQEKLYGSATRWYKDLPEPAADERTLRSLRTDLARALARATGTNPGPVHLNVPFSKPLEPVEVPGDVPEALGDLAESGRPSEGRGDRPAFVRTSQGDPELGDEDLRRLAQALETDRGLVVAGPSDPHAVDPEALVALSHATDFPILADPLSGLRFGGHTRVAPVLGGYDAYLHEAVTASWPDPEVVVRVGASPTSKRLRTYLARADARQFVVDPAGAWREAEFTASDLVVADPSKLAGALSRLVGGGTTRDGGASGGGASAWLDRWQAAEDAHWETVEAALDETDATTGPDFFEGAVLADVTDLAPEPSTLFVSNSMPVRDLDRFAEPSTASLTAMGNRGASGIDGIVSSALGAGAGTTDDLTLVLGDLAYYHDMNGLLSVARCGVDATVVLVNNDGGGIFHMLPIEEFDPPFTSQFKTPHGIDFEPTGDLYGLGYERVESRETFRETYREATREEGTTVVEVVTDAESSHDRREDLAERVRERLTED